MSLTLVQNMPDAPIANLTAKSLVRLRQDATGTTVHLLAELSRDELARLLLWWEGTSVIREPSADLLQTMEVKGRSEFSLDAVASHARYLMRNPGSWFTTAVVPLVSSAELRASLIEHLVSLGRGDEVPLVLSATHRATDSVFLDIVAGQPAVEMFAAAHERVAEVLPWAVTGMEGLIDRWRSIGASPFPQSLLAEQREAACVLAFMAVVHGFRL